MSDRSSPTGIPDEDELGPAPSAPAATTSSGLQLVPVTFDEACLFVAMHHRHLPPSAGHKFSMGVADGTLLVGVATVGRPTPKAYDNGRTLEINRTATDGTKNANSMLYGAAWRAAKALGYRRVITYNQEGESGASLKAAGYVVVAERPARPGWDTPSRRRTNRADRIPRRLWEPAETALARTRPTVVDSSAPGTPRSAINQSPSVGRVAGEEGGA